MVLRAGLPSAYLFQSTLPVRGATLLGKTEVPVDHQFQSTLPVRGATAKIDKPTFAHLFDLLNWFT